MQFLPISGLLGVNMKERLRKDVCPWYDGPCLFEALDAVELADRDPSGPFRSDHIWLTSETSDFLVMCLLEEVLRRSPTFDGEFAGCPLLTNLKIWGRW